MVEQRADRADFQRAALIVTSAAISRRSGLSCKRSPCHPAAIERCDTSRHRLSKSAACRRAGRRRRKRSDVDLSTLRFVRDVDDPPAIRREVRLSFIKRRLQHQKWFQGSPWPLRRQRQGP